MAWDSADSSPVAEILAWKRRLEEQRAQLPAFHVHFSRSVPRDVVYHGNHPEGGATVLAHTSHKPAFVQLSLLGAPIIFETGEPQWAATNPPSSPHFLPTERQTENSPDDPPARATPSPTKSSPPWAVSPVNLS